MLRTEKMQSFLIISISTIFLLLTNGVVDAKIGFGAIASGGFKFGQFVWETQKIPIIENLTLVQVHEGLRETNKYLESVFLETTYQEKYKNALVNIIEQTMKIDTTHKTMLDFLKLKMGTVSSNEKTKNAIIKFAQASLTTDPDQSFDKYNTLWIDVQLKLVPALKEVNSILQGKFVHTCSIFEHQLESYQQKLVQIFELVKLAELKVFFTIKGSAKLLRRYEKVEGDYKPIVKQLVDSMKGYSVKISNDFREIISEASQNLWRCDPVEHKQGITYVPLNNVFQKFIVNEVNLNTDCQNSCSVYNDIKQNDTCNTFSEDSTCLHSRRCGGEHGKLYSCKSAFKATQIVSFTGELRICQSKAGENRRYDRIQTSDFNLTPSTKQTIGPKTECGEGQRETKEAKYFLQRWSTKPCTVCICTCDDNVGYLAPNRKSLFPPPVTTTDRFFYAKRVMSSIDRNYVITGARLVKNNTVVYIQIQQGKLLKEGVIDQSTVSWKEENEDELYNPNNLVGLAWDRRSIELQDIDVPAGHVLVGLQFVRPGSRLKLQVHSVPFDFGSGTFSDPSGKPVLSVGKPINTGIDLEDSKLPPSDKRSIEVLTNQYLNFSTSNFMSDLGQTTVPFLDLQPVITNQATPMGGVGLYYKYTSGYSGYLGLKLKTYDLSQHLASYNDEKEVNFTVLSLEDGNVGVFAE